MARRLGEEITGGVCGSAAVTVEDVEVSAQHVDVGRSAVDVLQAGARGQGEAAGNACRLASGQSNRIERFE
jgi:hypothetical protein